MALPINARELLSGKSVEWERLEFKKGWNPISIMRTMCAFANDFHNWSGGYIIVGVEEIEGRPKFPILGIAADQVDRVQAKILELSHKISPNYFPVIQPLNLDGKTVVIIWCPAGEERPYSVPNDFANKQSPRSFYIRIGSSSIIARGSYLRRLQEQMISTPFDNRINRTAQIEDLDIRLIQDFLHKIGSDLLQSDQQMNLEDLGRAMQIIRGPKGECFPLNLGLLFFSERPDKYFQRAWIEIVLHQGNDSHNFSEHYFKGPLHTQLQSAMSFIESKVIVRYFVKETNEIATRHFYNYPIKAVKEALCNAVYHKDYGKAAPIEVQIRPDSIRVLSYPGPMSPVNAEALKEQKQIFARDYRNRRIGDYLKELHLIEGRGTGFPTIYKKMAENGSPPPVFETDENCSFFLATLPARLPIDDTASPTNLVNEPATKLRTDATSALNCLYDILLLTHQREKVANPKEDKPLPLKLRQKAAEIVAKAIHPKLVKALDLLRNQHTANELFFELEMEDNWQTRNDLIEPLINLGWLTRAIKAASNTETAESRYFLTRAGEKLQHLLLQDE